MIIVMERCDHSEEILRTASHVFCVFKDAVFLLESGVK